MRTGPETVNSKGNSSDRTDNGKDELITFLLLAVLIRPVIAAAVVGPPGPPG